MKTRKPMKFVDIPPWAIDTAERSRYTVAAAFRLAELSDVWVRLTAATQRAIFGAVLFGKCSIRCGTDGIHTSRTACFGTDFVATIIEWDGLERCMKTGQRPCI